MMDVCSVNTHTPNQKCVLNTRHSRERITHSSAHPPTHPCPTDENSVFKSDTAGGPTDRLGQLNGHAFSHPEPLVRAPDNVYVFRGKNNEVLGWRNVFDLPIQYDVELCPRMLSPESLTLAFRFLPKDGPRRRFIVIGESSFSFASMSYTVSFCLSLIRGHFDPQKMSICRISTNFSWKTTAGKSSSADARRVTLSKTKRCKHVCNV